MLSPCTFNHTSFHISIIVHKAQANPSMCLLMIQPSSQKSHLIEGCGWHFSQIAKRQVYGHQFVAVVFSCDGITIPYQMILYEKDKASKIELIQQILKTLPNRPLKGYFLSDNWYTCASLLTLLNLCTIKHIMP